MYRLVNHVTVTTSNGKETTHTYELGQLDSLDPSASQVLVDRFWALMASCNVTGWRDVSTQYVFMLSNPLRLYNGAYVISIDFDAKLEQISDEPKVEAESPISEVEERMGFLAAIQHRRQ